LIFIKLYKKNLSGVGKVWDSNPQVISKGRPQCGIPFEFNTTASQWNLHQIITKNIKDFTWNEIIQKQLTIEIHCLCYHNITLTTQNKLMFGERKIK